MCLMEPSADSMVTVQVSTAAGLVTHTFHSTIQPRLCPAPWQSLRWVFSNLASAWGARSRIRGCAHTGYHRWITLSAWRTSWAFTWWVRCPWCHYRRGRVVWDWATLTEAQSTKFYCGSIRETWVALVRRHPCTDSTNCQLTEAAAAAAAAGPFNGFTYETKLIIL